MPVRRLILATAALCSPIPLCAEAPEPVEDQGEAGSIIVTAKRDRRMADLAGTQIFAGKIADVTSLTDLPPITNRNLRVALTEIPGLLVSEVSNGSWASLSYRGLGEPHESWNLLTMQDAVPAVPDMYSYPAGYFIPPLDLVDRIEFVRGASGLLYGPTPGGALNYVMKAPRRVAGFDVTARASYGNLGTASGSVAAAFSDGQKGADAFISYATTDGPRRANSDGTQWTGRLRGYLTGDRLTATVALDVYQGDFGEPGGLTLARLQADRRDVSLANDRIRLRRFVPSLTVEWQPDDETQVTARAWYSWFERLSSRQAGGSFGLITPAANVLIRQNQQFRTGALDLRVRRDFGVHTLTLGMLGHTSDAPVFVDKGLSATDREGLAGPLARVARTGDALAVFGEARFVFGQVQIVPGFRLERLRQRVGETLDLATGSATAGPPGAPNGPLGARGNVDTVALWGLGATWDATDTLRFVVNASRGFKPKLYNDGVTFQAGVDAAGTFEATYATTIEGAMQARPVPPLQLDVSLFRVEFDNQVGFLAGPLPAQAPFGAVGIGGARRQNVGSMRNQGVDLGAMLDLGGPRGIWGGDATVRLTANAQLLDAVFTDGAARGFRPQYAPKHLIRASAQYIGKDDARVALIFTDVARQEGSDNNAPDFALPGYRVVDLSAQFPLTRNLLIGASIGNLFDVTYASRVRPGGGGGFDPGLPRTALVNLTLRN